MNARTAVVVAGTGRMGRDVGLWCLGRGMDVTWVSRDAGRLDALRARLARDLRRLAAGDAPPGEAAFAVAGAGAFARSPDVVLEAIEEDAAAKRALLDALAARAGPGALLLSTSSSLVPSSLHPRCLGAHFFYPVALTGFVEAIVPAVAAPDAVVRLRAWLADLGLAVLAQDERSAFAVNRLLLPLQNECLRMLADGAAPDAVEAAVAPVLGTGLLAWMDAVGLDVVAAAVGAYRARMAADDARDLAALADGLAALVAAGKRGRRNGDGLLCGGPLPWPVRDGALPDDATAAWRALWAAGCRRAIAARELDGAGLQVALSGLFGIQYAAEADPAGDALAAAWFARTGLSYWRPGTRGAGQDR